MSTSARHQASDSIISPHAALLAMQGIDNFEDDDNGSTFPIAGPSSSPSHPSNQPHQSPQRAQRIKSRQSLLINPTLGGQAQEENDGDGGGGVVIVKALYDYQGNDPSALSFNEGDIIEVISMLDSGWWDGIVGENKRGWFPSNFVRELTDEEMAELEMEGIEDDEFIISGPSAQSQQQHNASIQPTKVSGHGNDEGRGIQRGKGGDILNMDDVLGVQSSSWGNGDDELEALAKSMGVGAGAGSSPIRQGQNGRKDIGGINTNTSSVVMTDFSASPAFTSTDGDTEIEDEFSIAASKQREKMFGMSNGNIEDNNGFSYKNGESSTSTGIRGMELSPPIQMPISGSSAIPNKKKMEREPNSIDLTEDDEDDGFGGEVEENFGSGLERAAAAKRRERETTAGTLRVIPESSVLENTPRAPGRKRDSRDGGDGGNAEDAWIPKLTADGQIYYHNPQTGEDSWDMPSTPNEFDDDGYFSPPYTATSDTFSSPIITTGTAPNGGFVAPPKAQQEMPHPWTSKMQEDGSGYYYVNRLTGETRQTLPPTMNRTGDLGGISENLRDASLDEQPEGSTTQRRKSEEARRKELSEWEKASEEKLDKAIKTSNPSPNTILIENVNDAMREVFEAAVSGSAAEEEISRATDLNSPAALTSAIQREESAVEALSTAHQNVLAAIRDLLRANGYVGPIDRIEELPRPPWTGDMTLIGSIGMFSSVIHAAVTSKRVIPDSGLPPWQELMRSASKLRDVIGNLPELLKVTSPTTTTDHPFETMQTKSLECHLGIGGLKGLCGGRWGFVKEYGEPRRTLDQHVILESQAIEGDLQRLLSNGQSINEMDILRLINRLRIVLDGVDLASVLDLDGDHTASANQGNFQTYRRLVDQAVNSLNDLDRGYLELNHLAGLLYLNSAGGDIGETLRKLSGTVSVISKSLTSLQLVASDQAAMVASNRATGSIGKRSPYYAINKERPLSMISSVASKQSVASRSSYRNNIKGKVRGIEDDFQDSEDLVVERLASTTSSTATGPYPASSSKLNQHRPTKSKDQSAPSPDSGSQVSLTKVPLGHSRTRSAESSNVSLANQKTESDSGSTKGSHRSSFMRAFMRKDSDDGRSTTRMKNNKKLAKLLGEDVQWSVPEPQPLSRRTTASIPPPLILETPSYLMEDYAPHEIVFDDKGNLKAGTLRALVDRLTHHGATDTNFFKAFMLTFRSFTNGDQLSDLLIDRYHIPCPSGLTEIQIQDWVKQKQTPIRLRVANVFRSWLDEHFMQSLDMLVLDKIEHFANVVMLQDGSEMLKMLSKTLLTLAARRRRGEDPNLRRIVSGGTLSPPAPLVPRVTGKNLQLTDIQPIELARQLTIMESQNFQKIKAPECLHKNWTAEDVTLSPNIRMVINSSNKLAAWVGLIVLQPRDAKSRAALMKYFVQAAVELRNLNNFSGMAGIVAGLNAAPIDRLKRTKELLSSKTSLAKLDLDKTMDSSKNFANYKIMLKTVNPPCVPFLGFYLSALTFIEDGNRDIIDPNQTRGGMTPSGSSSSLSNGLRPLQSTITTDSSSLNPTGGENANDKDSSVNGSVQPKEPLVNFFKRNLTAEIIRDIQQYQSQPYNLAKCKPVYDFLENGLHRVEHAGDPYERSLMLEPREREEERVARMLHDSVRSRYDPGALGAMGMLSMG